MVSREQRGTTAVPASVALPGGGACAHSMSPSTALCDALSPAPTQLQCFPDKRKEGATGSGGSGRIQGCPVSACSASEITAGGDRHERVMRRRVLQAAVGNTSAPFIVASGAQERPPGLPVEVETGRVRVTATPMSSAVVLVPIILASILAVGIIAALSFQFVRTRSTRRNSLPSTMDKSTSGTVRCVLRDVRAAGVHVWP